MQTQNPRRIPTSSSSSSTPYCSPRRNVLWPQLDSVVGQSVGGTRRWGFEARVGRGERKRSGGSVKAVPSVHCQIRGCPFLSVSALKLRPPPQSSSPHLLAFKWTRLKITSRHFTPVFNLNLAELNKLRIYSFELCVRKLIMASACVCATIAS